MKRTHIITLAGEELTLSLSFKTSLDILDKVASPMAIMEQVSRAAASGETASVLDERSVVKILCIANAPFEGKTINQIGDLAFAHGFVEVIGLLLEYLTELVMGRSKELTEGDTSAEK